MDIVKQVITWDCSRRCTGCLTYDFLPIRFLHTSFLLGETRVLDIQKEKINSFTLGVMKPRSMGCRAHKEIGKLPSPAALNRFFAAMKFLLCKFSNLDAAETFSFEVDVHSTFISIVVMNLLRKSSCPLLGILIASIVLRMASTKIVCALGISRSAREGWLTNLHKISDRVATSRAFVRRLKSSTRSLQSL